MYEQDTHLMESLKVSSYPKAFNHVIYLDEAISNSAYYRNAILTLKTASPDDSVEIIFNTEGGLCHTASVFLSAMKECQCPIIGNLSGLCASAGTAIALQCDSWKIDENLVFMIHTTAYGAGNSAEKVIDQVTFTDKWTKDMNRRIYEGFLSEDELSLMLEHGKEYWFNEEEVSKRLQAYSEYREDKQVADIQQQMEAQWAEEDAVADEALATLVATGKYTQADIDKFKAIIEDADKVLENGETVEPSNPCCIEESNILSIPDVNGVHWELTFEDGGDSFYNIEIESDQDLYSIDTAYLEELDLDHLKTLADLFEIPYAHNIKAETLAKKVVEFFEMTIIDSLE